MRETTYTRSPATPAGLAEFIWRAFRIRIPDTPVCPGHSTPWRAFCSAYFAETPGCVWKAARGLGGKTFLEALLAVCEAVLLKANVNVLGGSGRQSKIGLGYVADLLTTRSNIVSGASPATITHETRLSNGSTITALLASQTSVRGPHPQRLRLDEVDEIKRGIFDSALGQPMSRDGVKAHVLASSTHQYPDGTMTHALKLAREKGWATHTWCYKETSAGPHAWLTQEMIEEKRSQMTSAQFAVECDLQEPSVEGRAILTPAVEAMFRRDIGDVEGLPGCHHEFEAPVPGARYATAADWAKAVNFTDIGTFRTDAPPMRLVAFERMQRVAWPYMVGRFAKRIARYPGKAAHDATGVGSVVDDNLRDAGVTTAEPFMMVGRARRDLFTEYITAIEGGEIVAPFIASVEAEHRYVTVEDLYGSGHPPDSVVMGALAYRAARHNYVAAAEMVAGGETRGGYTPHATYGQERTGLFTTRR